MKLKHLIVAGSLLCIGCTGLVLLNGGYIYAAISLSIMSSTFCNLAYIKHASEKSLEAVKSFEAAHKLNTHWQTCEIHSMMSVFHRFPDHSISTTPWSISFTNLHAIVQLLDQHKPKTIVEFGSGLSTICIAKWLKERGEGQLFSVDHDDDWASQTTGRLCEQELHDYAKVCLTTMSETNNTYSGVPWYVLPPQIKSLRSIDLVIVDGPPANSSRIQSARSPALPELLPQLSDSAILLLDDARRPGESALIDRWVKDYPNFEVNFRGGQSGLACLYRTQRS